MFKLSTCAIALIITAVPAFADTTDTTHALNSAEMAKTGSSIAGEQMTANQDFGKLSVDGAKAIRDVRLARIAIFNGQSNQAKSYTNEAEAEIARAEGDNTSFMKAEADLKTPKGVSQLGSGTPSTTPVAWIPVDGSITFGEDYVATPAKSASLAKANDQLHKGQNGQAMETLKLADIDVSYILEVAPLRQTATDIQQAAQLVNQGKYYEANQALKMADAKNGGCIERLCLHQ
jgi:hypothetical protein